MAKTTKKYNIKKKSNRVQTIKTIYSFLTGKKVPLVLLVLAQSYILFLWLIGSNIYHMPLLTISIAVITAVSLDSVVVSTTFSKSRSRWSWTTGLVAMISGVAIVLDLFYKMEWYWLHAIFPILVFFFSQHLAEENGTVDNTNNNEEMIARLVSAGLDNTAIYNIIGGNRTTVWKLINDIRALQSSNTQ